jgi:hypothetical protein
MTTEPPRSVPPERAEPTEPLEPELPAPPEHCFEGMCRVCGTDAVFELYDPSLREGFVCPTCRSRLRDQGQADVLLRRYGCGRRSLAELVDDRSFQELDVYECGVPSHFKPYLQSLPGYVESTFWPDAEPGEIRDGVRCEDLMRLTLPANAFDVVITSDVFEHVRRPYDGFTEVRRVLRPGGVHVFSIPITLPMRKETRARVDTSGDEDVFLIEPRYHNGKHLVYTDFGADLVTWLSELGFDTEAVRFEAPDAQASRLLTFCSVKRGGRLSRAWHSPRVRAFRRVPWRRASPAGASTAD